MINEINLKEELIMIIHINFCKKLLLLFTTVSLFPIYQRIVLSGMISRKRGAIVNIGSAAGVSSSPLLAQYGAAKSYIAMFSKGACCAVLYCTLLCCVVLC
jgi:short-subunit dehydrogenase